MQTAWICGMGRSLKPKEGHAQKKLNIAHPEKNRCFEESCRWIKCLEGSTDISMQEIDLYFQLQTVPPMVRKLSNLQTNGINSHSFQFKRMALGFFVTHTTPLPPIRLSQITAFLLGGGISCEKLTLPRREQVWLGGMILDAMLHEIPMQAKHLCGKYSVNAKFA